MSPKTPPDPQYFDLDFARRLENAEAENLRLYVQAHQQLYPQLHATGIELAGGYVAFLGENSPVGRAVGMGLNGPVEAVDWLALERFYNQRQVPIYFDLCPLVPVPLILAVSERGYSISLFKNVWTRPLAEPPRLLPAEAVQVTAVDLNQASLWMQVVAAGFDHQDDLHSTDTSIAAPFFFMARSFCFLGWLDGQPGGGATMSLSADGKTASLFSTSTRPSFRRRGIHAALLNHRLKLARSLGAEWAVVQTTPGSYSQRNIQRVGFSLAYTKLTLERRFPPA